MVTVDIPCDQGAYEIEDIDEKVRESYRVSWTNTNGKDMSK